MVSYVLTCLTASSHPVTALCPTYTEVIHVWRTVKGGPHEHVVETRRGRRCRRCHWRSRGPDAARAEPAARAYIIAEVQVTDPEAYKPYIPKAAQIVAQYGGQYLARGGKTESLEGAEPAGRVAIVQFPSMADLQKFWNSPEYREVAPIRRGASKSRLFVVEGVSP